MFSVKARLSSTSSSSVSGRVRSILPISAPICGLQRVTVMARYCELLPDRLGTGPCMLDLDMSAAGIAQWYHRLAVDQSLFVKIASPDVPRVRNGERPFLRSPS